MTYTETVEYLFNSTPMFQNVGSAGYKEGLDNTITLDNHFDNPHKKFKTIHIGGTNGKGSCSHTIAAILQSAGYKVGLFTSPHLVDFRERIRINGMMIPEQYVIDFVENEKDFFEPLHPSFFELTTALAFKYFAENNVDIAVIEVGLGGRLDCTNIISPILSVITNIGFDHIQFLGNTLEKIASEKAGIIKNNTPVVIGETTPETRTVFIQKATSTNSAIYLAEENDIILSHQHSHNGGIDYETKTYGTIHGELSGLCQIKNTATILTAINVLTKIGLAIQAENISEGFKHVCKLTGLRGRWEKIEENPITICDTGHNINGLEYIVKQLQQQKYEKLHIVFGMVNDKDIEGVLSIMPKDATYYFCQASVKRAMPSQQLKALAEAHELKGNTFANVLDAYNSARQNASQNDFIYIGGSSFIVADLIASL
ncbi:MAG: bifunctional folylpolyglutamate synthase/dihydrofolate synthase [Bacteroidaceae bacterium]|nr:bifunctional folylpolyglutamate synthase/dihydrofolate synthase [Bacteroidaceae bacterium]